MVDDPAIARALSVACVILAVIAMLGDVVLGVELVGYATFLIALAILNEMYAQRWEQRWQ